MISKPNISSCLLVPLAILQSEIFWIYSAVYCLLLDSVKQTPSVQHKAHKRSFSDPQIRSIDQKDEPMPLTVQERASVLRRESLPTITHEPFTIRHDPFTIRHRPTIHDELNGTTCPPVWWQKTKIKFSHHNPTLISLSKSNSLPIPKPLYLQTEPRKRKLFKKFTCP